MRKISSGTVPMGDESYNRLKATEWLQVREAFLQGIKESPTERPTLGDIKDLLNAKIKSTPYNLAVHQGTAFNDAFPFGMEGIFVEPANDGTNACAFLACKVSEHILFQSNICWKDLVTEVESIITNFPKDLNQIRNKEKQYDPEEAYELMFTNSMISELQLKEMTDKDLGYEVFSTEGMKDLAQMIGEIKKTAVLTVSPYTFMLGREMDQIFLVDTHLVSPKCDGKDGGIIKVFPDVSSCTRWIWMRLHSSGIKNAQQQLFEVTKASSVDQAMQKNIDDSLTSDKDWDNHMEFMPMEPITSESIHCGNTGPVEVPLSKEHSIRKQQYTSCGLSVGSNEQPREKNLSFPENWYQEEQSKFGPHNLPYFANRDSKLSFAEQLALVKVNLPKATRTPQGCKRNAIFVVDSSRLGHPDDVQSDLNGVYKKCLEVKSHVVEITEGCTGKQSVKVKARKKIPLIDNQWYLRVNRKVNEFGLARNISYFTNQSDEILGNSIIMQYVIDKSVCEDVQEVQFKVKAHGNSTATVKNSFYPLKKSTLNNIRNEIAGSNKRNFAAVFNDGLLDEEGAVDFGDRPRSKKQFWDMAKSIPEKMRENPENEVEAILAYNEELEEESIIWSHSDIPDDMWVLGTSRMINDLSHAAGGLPLSVDPTFNHGEFEVTPITYRHQLLLSKSKNVQGEWNNTTLVGPTIVHHVKSEETFDRGIREVSRRTGLDHQKFGLITDGEVALINACAQNMPESVPLRCTAHFKENCREYLKSIGIKGEIDQSFFLDVIFGNDGLVEAEDKHDLKERLKLATKVLDEMEISMLELPKETKPQFSRFLKQREKKVLRQVIRDARRKGGMPSGINGIPARVYTHQSETVNSVLAAKKQALGFAKKDDISKTQFIRSVWQRVVQEQDLEIERALYGQSDRLRLTKDAEYLQVEVEDWFNWSKKTRLRLVCFYFIKTVLFAVLFPSKLNSVLK